MLTHDFSRAPFVNKVQELNEEESRSLSLETLQTKYANAPVLLRDTARRAASADWSDVFNSLADSLCEVSTHLDFGATNSTLRGTVRFGDFHRCVQQRELIYMQNVGLFEHLPEIMSQVISELPEVLLDDVLDILPPSWGFLRAATRTTLFYGAVNSRTALHIDSMNTVTWNMCLTGTKRWLLFSCQGRGVGKLGGPGFDAYSSLDRNNPGAVFLSPEAIVAYNSEKPPRDRVEFYTVDAAPGTTLYLPWGWAHQVQNLSTSLSVSRYYVGPQNFQEFVAGSQSKLGRVAPKLLHLLMATEKRRALLKKWSTRRAMSGRVIGSVCNRVLRIDSPLRKEHHWFTRV